MMPPRAAACAVAAVAWAALGRAPERAYASGSRPPHDAGVAPPRADASGAAAAFDAAVDLLAESDAAAAAAAFEAVADRFPGAAQADDAVYEAAKLYESRLGDPARALALYERLARDYPTSRLALAARRRADAVRADLGPDGGGARALARFNAIVQAYPQQGDAASIAAVDALLAEYPDWPGAPRAALWAARVCERSGDLACAARRYDDVARQWPDRPEAFEALRGAAEVAIARGDFATARDRIARMRDDGDSARLRARQAAQDRLDRAAAERRWYRAAVAALALSLATLLASVRQAAGSWRAALAALRRPPTEAIYLIPVAAALVAFALTGHEALAPATATILGIGIAAAWLSGAGLSVDRAPARAIAHAALSAIAVAAAIYIALHRTHLLELIARTVRFGPAH
ncbi:MAG: hypothetical protein D6689_03785 [Deltaproteobacteria bacterium]|nr:MAG: hypothetical protein D6689_03785 [Deltaproteobacteria bacterium]